MLQPLRTPRRALPHRGRAVPGSGGAPRPADADNARINPAERPARDGPAGSASAGCCPTRGLRVRRGCSTLESAGPGQAPRPPRRRRTERGERRASSAAPASGPFPATLQGDARRAGKVSAAEGCSQAARGEREGARPGPPAGEAARRRGAAPLPVRSPGLRPPKFAPGGARGGGSAAEPAPPGPPAERRREPRAHLKSL